jgi:hypothetical protein
MSINDLTPNLSPGSDKADALPSVKSAKDADGGGPAVVEEIEKHADDLESAFKEVVQRAMKPIEIVEVREVPSEEDSNKTFRTRLVALWLLTNGALVIAITYVNVPQSIQCGLTALLSQQCQWRRHYRRRASRQTIYIL